MDTEERPTPDAASDTGAPGPDRITDLDLERVAALGWPGLETDWLGDWLLRAGGGFTGRANSMLPLGDPGVPLDDAVALVRRWYADRSLPTLVQLPLPARAELGAALEARGWSPYNVVAVLTADLHRVLAVTPRRGDLPAVTVSDEPDPRWLARYHYRGGALPDVGRRVLLAGPTVGFGRVDDLGGGRTLAVGRVAVAQGWAGVTAVEVAERARRRGLGTHLLRGLCEWAAARGAHAVYLQVDVTNLGALAVYGRAGFTVHHRYQYLREPAAG